MYDAILADAGSRFALFDASVSKDRWYLYGDWREHKGMNVSNLTFCSYTKLYAGYRARYPMGSLGTPGTGRNYGEDDWRDEWYYDDETAPPILATSDEVVEGQSVDNFCYVCKGALCEADLPYGYCDECGLENNFNCEQCGERPDLDYLTRDNICEKCLTLMYREKEGE